MTTQAIVSKTPAIAVVPPMVNTTVQTSSMEQYTSQKNATESRLVFKIIAKDGHWVFTKVSPNSTPQTIITTRTPTEIEKESECCDVIEKYDAEETKAVDTIDNAVTSTEADENSSLLDKAEVKTKTVENKKLEEKKSVEDKHQSSSKKERRSSKDKERRISSSLEKEKDKYVKSASSSSSHKPSPTSSKSSSSSSSQSKSSSSSSSSSHRGSSDKHRSDMEISSSSKDKDKDHSVSSSSYNSKHRSSSSKLSPSSSSEDKYRDNKEKERPSSTPKSKDKVQPSQAEVPLDKVTSSSSSLDKLAKIPKNSKEMVKSSNKPSTKFPSSVPSSLKRTSPLPVDLPPEKKLKIDLNNATVANEKPSALKLILSKKVQTLVDTKQQKGSSKEDDNDDEMPEVKKPGPGCGPNGPPGVLLLYRPKGSKKKLTWRSQETLEQVHYFELDENERCNVTKKSFKEKMNLKSCNKSHAIVNHESNMKPQTHWRKLIEIDYVPHQNKQYIKQLIEFHRARIPDSPAETEIEPIFNHDVPLIPLDNLMGNSDAVKDFTSMPSFKPRGSQNQGDNSILEIGGLKSSVNIFGEHGAQVNNRANNHTGGRKFFNSFVQPIVGNHGPNGPHNGPPKCMVPMGGIAPMIFYTGSCFNGSHASPLIDVTSQGYMWPGPVMNNARGTQNFMNTFSPWGTTSIK